MPINSFVDIHCHTSMRAFHTTPNGHQKNIWEATKNDVIDSVLGRWAWENSKGVSKFSQSNLYNCMRGNARVIFDSLYPVERGFINFRKIPELIIGKKANETLVVTTSGISIEQFRAYKKSHDYPAELEEQYRFLIDSCGPSPCGKYRAALARNFTELEQNLLDPATISIIPTIEGAHVLGCGTIHTEHIRKDELTQNLLRKIESLKALDHPPFFITFAHHFWNQLCGHATTFPTPTRITCTQQKGLNTGMNPVGWEVLRALLSNDNGKRILIDTRHMSVAARKDFYTFVLSHNSKNPDNIIPVISSHSAVNGFDTMHDSALTPDNMSKKKSTDFCAWSLNISAEEARIIHQTGGIAGIILDKGRHSGINRLKSVERIKNATERKAEFAKMIWDNIFFYVQAIGEKSGWNLLTLGTDFDGVITHFDDYPDMSALPQLKADLIDYLTNTGYRRNLWFSYTPEELTDKIFRRNAMHFLKQHFN